MGFWGFYRMDGDTPDPEHVIKRRLRHEIYGFGRIDAKNVTIVFFAGVFNTNLKQPGPARTMNAKHYQLLGPQEASNSGHAPHDDPD